ncbi:TonB family protein [Pelagicoccus sp. SDUM812002]|uniref:TonB family protein n=1 Tax=Pelagicoccus sp. SDUM812002 TaxID=3041266 RepID=UPI00280E5FFA|nr:TonB family protein [Pelagicoccus sp. SDUM812002]MDQ8188467.1 TonB family protein [Pelagicoccus sp. SDUM812002]
MNIKTILLTLLITATLSLQASEKFEYKKVEYPVYAISQDFMPTKFSNPIYPAKARKEKRGGKVVIGAVVNEKGKVTDAFIKESEVEADLEQACLTSIRRSRFPVASKHSREAPYIIFIPMTLEP